MTNEQYLKKCAERDADLKARGIALVIDDPLDEEYFEQVAMKPFYEQLDKTIAEMEAHGLPMGKDYSVTTVGL